MLVKLGYIVRSYTKSPGWGRGERCSANQHVGNVLYGLFSGRRWLCVCLGGRLTGRGCRVDFRLPLTGE